MIKKNVLAFGFILSISCRAMENTQLVQFKNYVEQENYAQAKNVFEGLKEKETDAAVDFASKKITVHSSQYAQEFLTDILNSHIETILDNGKKIELIGPPVNEKDALLIQSSAFKKSTKRLTKRARWHGICCLFCFPCWVKYQSYKNSGGC